MRLSNPRAVPRPPADLEPEDSATMPAYPHLADQARVQEVITGLENAMRAAFDLLRDLSAPRSDGDEWTRMPAPPARCAISGWSRSSLYRLGEQGLIRTKTVRGSAFYSAADVRSLLKIKQEGN